MLAVSYFGVFALLAFAAMALIVVRAWMKSWRGFPALRRNSKGAPLVNPDLSPTLIVLLSLVAVGTLAWAVIAIFYGH